MAILGIDEVGRGPLAGPLVVGAVILPEEKNGMEWFSELKDSKKISAKKREKLNDTILAEAKVGLGWVSSDEIDNVGISEALRLATKRAVKSVQRLHVAFSQIVIDGKVNFLAGTPLEEYVSVLVKADDLIKEVSAASIVAKVARDNYMHELAVKFPEYGFDKHVGYGTRAHIEAINKYGVCSEHRLSFEPCKSLTGFCNASDKVRKNTTEVGRKAEEKVAEYLINLGHEIVERNFRTKLCEIDIISVCDNQLYFTEVKYRKNDFAGGGIMAIDNKKLKQMEFAVKVFLDRYQRYNGFGGIFLSVASVSGDDFSVDDWFSV